MGIADSPDGEPSAAAELVEKAAAQVDADGKSHPLAVVDESLGMLRKVFVDAEGRMPGPRDDEFWSAYSQVLAAANAKIHQELG